MKCLSILLMFFMFIMSSGRAEAREPRYSSRYAPPYYHWGTAIIERGRIRNRYRKRGHLKW